jgi:hypothetical protein
VNYDVLMMYQDGYISLLRGVEVDLKKFGKAKWEICKKGQFWGKKCRTETGVNLLEIFE